MPDKILFICTGNTCRSPMAEALARYWLQNYKPEVEVSIISAGLAALPGSPASIQAVEVLKEDGIDISGHQAAMVDEEMLRDSDLVLTMTSRHKQALISYFPQFIDKIYTLTEYAQAGDVDQDIVDPFGQVVSVYKNCASQIKGLVEDAMKRYFTDRNR